MAGTRDKTYAEQKVLENITLLRKTMKDLPPFCVRFFRAIEPRTLSLTRLEYARDLRTFFGFLHDEISAFSLKPPHEWDTSTLNLVSRDDLERYMEYLTYYLRGEVGITNGARGQMRKLACLRSFFKYFFKEGSVDSNVAELIDMPKVRQKAIVRMEPDEAARMVDIAESGMALSDVEKRYHAHTAKRDTAIITLLLGTGMRVSECVGLNCADVDFSSQSLRVIRKGGGEAILYFSDEVAGALRTYLSERNAQRKSPPVDRNAQRKSPPVDRDAQRKSPPVDRDALFLSLQHRRLTTRAVQNLVKKYARLSAPLKRISPHKLRATYGTELYRATGDIYLVADALGHADVNTTKKHYADISDDQRRKAARAVTIRDGTTPPPPPPSPKRRIVKAKIITD